MPDNRGSPMENSLDDKFLKDRYEGELARKDKLSDSLGLPVSVLIALGGLIVTMVRGFSYAHPRLTLAFWISVGLDVVAYMIVLWYFTRAYHGNYEYERLPSLNALSASLNDYRAYYLEYPNASDEDKEQLALDDFDGNLRWRIIQAADKNAKSNDSRQGCLHLAIVFLFYVILGTIASSVPYAIDQVVTPGKTPVMHIDNFDGRKESLMAQPSAPSQTQPAPRPQAESKPMAPSKPEFPANTVFRNDQPVPQKK